MINNKNIFITGGTGSFGKEFIKTILKKYNPNKIIIYSRDELKQYDMQQSDFFGNKKNSKIIRYFIGDIRDKERLELAMNNNIDLVIHAAALKHVPIAEYNPFEFVKTNVIGAQNLIDVSLKYNIDKVIALSTDKAASPINLYGATKLTSDKLFIAANNFKGNKKIKFSVVRYGNVMSSRGSVIPYFLKTVKKGFFNITHKEMTRFNITLPEGVNFVLKSFSLMNGGEIFVPKIPSYNIIDLAKSISKTAKINIIGIRPGEKLHEEMITSSDAANTYEYKNLFVIYPDRKSNKLIKLQGKKCKNNFTYNSKINKHFLKILELKEMVLSSDLNN